MVEAPSDEEADAVCARLVALVERELGAATARAADIVVAMCGIVGYVGKRPARELLLDGLKARSIAAMTAPASR